MFVKNITYVKINRHFGLSAPTVHENILEIDEFVDGVELRGHGLHCSGSRLMDCDVGVFESVASQSADDATARFNFFGGDIFD